MTEFFAVMFRAITGVKLTPETIIVLTFIFFLGWMFGKLTRRIGVLKGIALAIFGTVAFTVLAYSPGVMVFAFLMGVLANHGPLIIQALYWAQDLADIVYALRYRQAFEDIRADEAQMEEEARREKADAYSRAHAQGDSSAQSRWRKDSAKSKAGADRAGEKEKERARRDTGPGGDHAQYDQDRVTGKADRQQQKKRRPPPPKGSVHDRHLETLGLIPGHSYSLEEIKRAYRKRAKETHPDAGGRAEDFIAVRAAWAALSKKR